MPAPELILAFDYGTRRVGVAAGDTLTRTARPLRVIEIRGAFPWPEIDRLVADYTPTQLVVGLPYNMDGTDTGMTLPAKDFSQLAAGDFWVTTHREMTQGMAQQRAAYLAALATPELPPGAEQMLGSF